MLQSEKFNNLKRKINKRGVLHLKWIITYNVVHTLKRLMPVWGGSWHYQKGNSVQQKVIEMEMIKDMNWKKLLTVVINQIAYSLRCWEDRSARRRGRVRETSGRRRPGRPCKCGCQQGDLARARVRQPKWPFSGMSPMVAKCRQGSRGTPGTAVRVRWVKTRSIIFESFSAMIFIIGPFPHWNSH